MRLLSSVFLSLSCTIEFSLCIVRGTYPGNQLYFLAHMARIEPKSLRDYPWYLRLIFWLQKGKYGAALESAKLWGRSTRVFLGFAYFFKALQRKRSPISPQLRSLISIHISTIINCPFCIDINSSIFIARKGKRDLLEELNQFEESDLFSEREKIALKYTGAISYTPNRVTDAMFVDLREHFTEDEIIELTALAAFQNCSSRFNTALGVSSQGFFR